MYYYFRIADSYTIFYKVGTMRHFIDHAMDKAMLLLDKETGVECGKVLAYYTDNPAGSVYHACVILYYHGWEVLGLDPNTDRPRIEGRAGGYGYDKYSAAVADSLQKQGLAGKHKDINTFTFGNGRMTVESREIQKNATQAIKDKKIIPVYSGAGNVREAFELYFRVIEIL
jgi:hypothetical protein